MTSAWEAYMDEYFHIVHSSTADHEHCIYILKKYLPQILDEIASLIPKAFNIEVEKFSISSKSLLEENTSVCRWLIVDSLSLICEGCGIYRSACMSFSKTEGSAPVYRFSLTGTESVASFFHTNGASGCGGMGIPGKYDTEHPNQEILKMEEYSFHPLRKPGRVPFSKFSDVMTFCLGRWIVLAVIQSFTMTEKAVHMCSTVSGRRNIGQVYDAFVYNLSKCNNMQKFALDLISEIRPTINEDILKRRLEVVARESGINFVVPKIETGNRFTEAKVQEYLDMNSKKPDHMGMFPGTVSFSKQQTPILSESSYLPPKLPDQNKATNDAEIFRFDFAGRDDEEDDEDEDEDSIGSIDPHFGISDLHNNINASLTNGINQNIPQNSQPRSLSQLSAINSNSVRHTPYPNISSLVSTIPLSPRHQIHHHHHQNHFPNGDTNINNNGFLQTPQINQHQNPVISAISAPTPTPTPTPKERKSNISRAQQKNQRSMSTPNINQQQQQHSPNIQQPQHNNPLLPLLAPQQSQYNNINQQQQQQHQPQKQQLLSPQIQSPKSAATPKRNERQSFATVPVD